MSYSLRQTSIALACCAALLAADHALAQGSIGGTLGKTDKSASSDEEQSPRRQKTGIRASIRTARPSSSFSGKWGWTARCDDATDWTGSFDMTHNSDGSVTGPFTGNGGSGSMSAKLSGNALSGTLCYTTHCTQFTFTLGSSLEGSEKSLTHGMCKYHGRRL
jgi:hypothetical protein